MCAPTSPPWPRISPPASRRLPEERAIKLSVRARNSQAPMWTGSSSSGCWPTRSPMPSKFTSRPVGGSAAPGAHPERPLLPGQRAVDTPGVADPMKPQIDRFTQARPRTMGSGPAPTPPGAEFRRAHGGGSTPTWRLTDPDLMADRPRDPPSRRSWSCRPAPTTCCARPCSRRWVQAPRDQTLLTPGAAGPGAQPGGRKCTVTSCRRS